MLQKTQYLIPLDWIEPTNHELDHEKTWKIATHLNTTLLLAFPGRFDDKGKFVITDGNHRCQALRLIGAEYAPIVLLTHQEFVDIAFHKKNIEFIVERSYKVLEQPVNL